jgi:phosphoglycolate phosphatase
MIGTLLRKARAPDQSCNVCGSTVFLDFRNRKAARCAGCQTLERGRLLQLILDAEGLVRPGMRVLHLAPEAGIGRNIRKVAGAGYRAVDLRPEIYPDDLAVDRFDLTRDAEALPGGTYDLVIHSHVMEHIPCALTPILWHLHRALKPGGHQLFCVPVMKGHTAMDCAAMTREEQTARFGQFDHVRRFGLEDFDRHLGMVFRLNPYDHASVLTPELAARHRIFVGPPVPYTSNTFFLQDKASLKLQ